MAKIPKDIKAKTIVAIDPGIANTGWAVLDNGLLTYGTIETSNKTSIPFRLKHIVLNLRNFKCTDVDIMLIEDFFGNYGKMTVWLIGHLVGALTALEYKMIQPALWVRDLFGKSKKGKYKECAMKLAKKLGHNPQTQHEADAISMIHWYRTCYEKKTKEKKI